ncbi:hypothetical protein EXT48_22930 [Pseudoalteromonas sp. CO348]|uniref:hypothetical protein n=1 Tax=Pseudoalteromonas sp. CO348 TaxID=1777271 RepID=UPI00102316EA|nr:hypothetical protein [Pseudoalteromonas sp. CO348]RZF98311.1 hypothetical protein EXT48_22930 [Pseudoalteromonas sp. CO348]
MSTSRNALDGFNQVMAAKSEVSRYEVEIPKNISPSAYDMIQDTSSQRMVSNYVNNNAGVIKKVNYFAAALVDVFGKVVNVDVVVPIVFSDDTKANLKISGIRSINEINFEYQTGSAETSRGSKIPDRLSDFQGRIKFGDLVEYGKFGTLALTYGVSSGTPKVCQADVIVNCRRISSGHYECTGQTLLCP